LLKELGKGGMGHVFMALTGQAGVERVCALKVLKEVRAGRDAEELTQRFLDEAKVVTKLSHEALVYVFDFGIHERQGYLAMEYVQGKSITETWNRCAARRDGFPIGLTLYYIGELVSALWYAANVDGLGLVHRDISPSNVMLTYTGGVKLIDFGLAKWKAKVVQTATGVQWGKTSYMSPEQYTGKPVDHRSDLFSAGVILWELLTGRQMFPPSETRAPNGTVPPPSRYTQDVPSELDRVVTKALAINPADRFQTGEEMCAALLAQMPSEAGGKLQAAKFIGRLFETEIRDEAAEQRDLVERAGRMDDPQPVSRSERRAIAEPINEGATTPDPDPDGLLGKTLSDRYYVRRLVGEGAMGRVYEGHHTGIGKRVAIKIAHKVERRKSELAKRFQREALAPAQIGHPNVADVTDCGTTEAGEFFFVMEFIDGVSLDTVIKRDGQLGIERALAIATQICRALEAAHRAGIIHRDLKPSNVMLVRSPDQDELVKVLDFGVAKFLHDTGDTANLTLTDATVGTPKYMAPEQIRGGGKVDFRSDIYALGAILYTMLAGGRLPIDGTTVDEIWQRKLTRDPSPLRNYRSDLPDDLEELILCCLARDPAQRPQSTEDLKKQLVAHLEAIRAMGDSILGMKSPSQTELLSERLRRRRARLGIGLGALTAVSIAALGMLFIGRPAPRQRGGHVVKPAAAPPTVVTEPPAPPPAPAAQPERAPVPAPEPPPEAAPTPEPQEEAVPAPERAPAVRIPSAGKHAASSAKKRGSARQRALVSNSASLPAATPEDTEPPAKSATAAPKAEAKIEPPPAPAAEPEETTAPSSEQAMAAIKKAESAFAEGHMATARVAATRAVAASKNAPTPARVRALIIMGKVQLASEQFADAERSFSRALDLDPTNAVARKGQLRSQVSAAQERQ
jgi:serine/threonine protein kinase